MDKMVKDDKIYILGAGTLGKLILDIIESNNIYSLVGFFDDNFPATKQIFNYPIIGKMSDININIVSNLAIGIGEPKYRKEIYEKKNAQGFKFPSMIHSSVILSKYCNIEEGVIIGPNSSILNGSVVKRGCCLLSHVNVNQDVLIEPFCLIAAGVIIGNNAILGEGCHIGLGNYIKVKQKIEPWLYYEAK